MLFAWKRAATLGDSSTLTLTALSCPASSRTTRSTAGPTIRHGPHHGAHRSTRTGTRAASATSAKSASPADTNHGSGALHWPQRGTPTAAGGTRLRFPQPRQLTMPSSNTRSSLPAAKPLVNKTTLVPGLTTPSV